MTTRRYGWRPDRPDHRDKVYAAPHLNFHTLPRRAGVLDQCPPVYDQAQTQSCTGNAVGFGVHFDLLVEHGTAAAPSRLFPYYNARVAEGTEAVDGGAAIRDVIRSLTAQGFCDETLWPFDLDKVTARPGPEAYAAAATHRVRDYHRLYQSADLIKAALALDKRPVLCGISVFESFESDAVAASGDVPLPDPAESFLGGHAIAIVLYDDDAQCFTFRNSYGGSWGDEGYGTLPYRYLLHPQLAADFWVIRTV